MLTTHEQHAKTKLLATIATLIVIAGAIVFVDHMRSEEAEATTGTTHLRPVATTTSASTPSTAQTPATTNSSANMSMNMSGYKDGSYSASSRYYVPSSIESIQVNVTLSNGTITAASIQNSEGDRTSAAYQQEFAAQYKSYVVGKKISGLQLGVIAGASDTTQGFIDALSQIASKAQA